MSVDLKPRKNAPKLFGWLYPSVVLTLVGSAAVELKGVIPELCTQPENVLGIKR